MHFFTCHVLRSLPYTFADPYLIVDPYVQSTYGYRTTATRQSWKIGHGSEYGEHWILTCTQMLMTIHMTQRGVAQER